MEFILLQLQKLKYLFNAWQENIWSFNPFIKSSYDVDQAACSALDLVCPQMPVVKDLALNKELFGSDRNFSR